ncbi:protein FAM174C [Pholidichthys leucotaenia]
MASLRALSAALVPLFWRLSSSGGSTELRPAASNSSSGPSPAQNRTAEYSDVFNRFKVDSSMIQRALYVLIGITVIGLLYFLIRAVRITKPVHRKKKYGLLSNYEDSVEMDAVDSEDDETLYEARSLRR